MAGKLHIAPATPDKTRPEEAPTTPEAVKVEPQLAGGESWGRASRRSSPTMWWWAST